MGGFESPRQVPRSETVFCVVRAPFGVGAYVGTAAFRRPLQAMHLSRGSYQSSDLRSSSRVLHRLGRIDTHADYSYLLYTKLHLKQPILHFPLVRKPPHIINTKDKTSKSSASRRKSHTSKHPEHVVLTLSKLRQPRHSHSKRIDPIGKRDSAALCAPTPPTVVIP